jgi:hypothetical protein
MTRITITMLLLCSIVVHANPITNGPKCLTISEEISQMFYITQEAESKIWHDLITPNLEESKSFYNEAFGWTYLDTNFKGLKYTIIYNNGSVIGGMIEVKTAKTSTWISALPLSNTDLNKRIRKIVAAGASKALPPIKSPGRGKQVIFEGLQGEEFSLISKNEFTEAMTSENGENDWLGMELWASDAVKAKAFYEEAFDVQTVETTYDDKPYWLFNIEGQTVAAMMNNPITNQGTQWVPYIQVSELTALFSKIKNTKAEVILSPSKEIRNGTLGIMQDPHGAIIAIQTPNP